MFPERFSNKTNGVTPRRWLLLANPALAGTITEAIGDGWICDLGELARLKPLAEDSAFRERFWRATRETKFRFAQWLKATCGEAIDPDSIFDSQVKRIHEYKRQLLNVLRIAVLYNRLRENPGLEVVPRTFLFAGRLPPLTGMPSSSSSSSTILRPPLMQTPQSAAASRSYSSPNIACPSPSI